MKNDLDEIVSNPAAYATFNLPEKPLGRVDNATWEIGKNRVDGTFITRQKAKWTGIDKFLERHGGKEYEHFWENNGLILTMQIEVIPFIFRMETS